MSVNSDFRTETFNVTASKLTPWLNEMNKEGGFCGIVVSRGLGALLTGPTRAFDAICQGGLAAAKVFTGVPFGVANTIGRTFSDGPYCPKGVEWEWSSALVNLVNAVVYAVQAIFIPFVALVSPAAADRLMNSNPFEWLAGSSEVEASRLYNSTG